MVRAVGPPLSRSADPTPACSNRAVVGARAISAGPAGMRPPVSTTGIRFPSTGE